MRRPSEKANGYKVLVLSGKDERWETDWLRKADRMRIKDFFSGKSVQKEKIPSFLRREGAGSGFLGDPFDRLSGAC